MSRRFERIRLLQAVYMPIVPQLISRRQRQLGQPEDLPEEEPLYFPSELAGSDLDVCSPGIAEIEERLREGQMHDALDKLRLFLHKKTGMVQFKDRNIRNQIATTRARSLLETNDAKIWAFVAKYRKARTAKLAIAGTGEWEKKWRVLRDEDVRTIAEGASTHHIEGSSSSRPLTEGRRQATWIWMSAGTVPGEAEFNYRESSKMHDDRLDLTPVL